MEQFQILYNPFIMKAHFSFHSSVFMLDKWFTTR